MKALFLGRFHDVYLLNYFLEFHFEKIEDVSTEKYLYIKCHNFERMSFDNDYENAINTFKNWLKLTDDEIQYAPNEAYFWTNKVFIPDIDLKTKVINELAKYT